MPIDPGIHSDLGGMSPQGWEEERQPKQINSSNSSASVGLVLKSLANFVHVWPCKC